MTRTAPPDKFYPATRPNGMVTRFPKIPKTDTLALPPKGKAVKASSVAEARRERLALDEGDPMMELMRGDPLAD